MGGMSWQSTALYYRLINEATKRELGGLHSARIAMLSVDFAAIEELQHKDDWAGCIDIMRSAARSIEAAGADFMLICTNTMHKVASEVIAEINIPLLHIADATAARILAAGHSKVGLLGTRFTMEEDFYKQKLTDQNLDVIVPNQEDREIIHRIIYDELCLGNVRDESREEFKTIIDKLVAAGAECVIEGCTEITMLIGPEDVNVPLFDTTEIHADEAVAMSLGQRWE